MVFRTIGIYIITSTFLRFLRFFKFATFYVFFATFRTFSRTMVVSHPDRPQSNQAHLTVLHVCRYNTRK